MDKKMKLIFFLFFPFYVCAENPSFYQGYLFYKNHLHNLDFDKAVEGMKAAHQGIEFDPEEIKKYQQKLYEETKEDKLTEANQFLLTLSAQEGVIEIVPEKLYVKVIQKGNGSKVKESDSPLMLYTAKTLIHNQEQEIHAIEEPKSILLKSTIPGFFKGVLGMQEGEKRILYIHPDLAYGSATSKVEPNSLMIFEVGIVKIASNN